MSQKDYDHTGCEYKNGFVRTCRTCGFAWEHGRNGKHSCIEQLKRQLQQARQEVAREIIQYIEDQGKVSFGSIMNRDIVCDIDDRDIAKLKQHFGLEG